MKKQKIDIIKCALIITLIITVILIAVYIYRFHNGLSYNHSDFADFGSYLSSITGLLAFIGVLYTVKDAQSNRQMDNERATFYNLLGLYQHQVDTIKYVEGNTVKNGIEAFKAYADSACFLFYAYVIYHFIKDERKFPIELKIETGLDEQVFQDICLGFKVNSIRELRKIITREKKYCYETIYKIMDIIDLSSHQEIYRIVSTAICNSMLQEKQYYQIYKFIRNVGEYLYGKHGQYLGQYYRNIYYMLNSLNDFEYKNDYSKIFRAQLSSDELTILLFNSISPQSTKRTISLLKTFDIFNNITAYALPMFGYELEKGKALQIIDSFFQEFVIDNENR